jgi:hypothetical protein
MRVERTFSRPVELGRPRASAAERDADVENEPAGIPAGESMVITEISQIVSEAYKIHKP